MVDGGDNIREATWESVSSMLQVVSASFNSLVWEKKKKKCLTFVSNSEREGGRSAPAG